MVDPPRLQTGAYLGPERVNLLVLRDKREFFDVETAQLEPGVLARLIEIENNMLGAQAYLRRVYERLRQTGSAKIDNIEVPACLKSHEASLSEPSGTNLSEEKSSSDTKPTPLPSGLEQVENIGVDDATAKR